MIDNTLLLFGLFRGIDLEVNGLMNIYELLGARAYP
jgi:hypothetical protein